MANLENMLVIKEELKKVGLSLHYVATPKNDAKCRKAIDACINYIGSFIGFFLGRQICLPEFDKLFILSNNSSWKYQPIGEATNSTSSILQIRIYPSTYYKEVEKMQQFADNYQQRTQIPVKLI